MTPEQIKRDTRLFGLVGDALEKTPLPAMLNAFYDFNGLNAFCSIFNIRDDDVPFFLTNIKTKTISGLFIQPSHGEKVLEYIDLFSPESEVSGAVDAILIKDGKLYGECFKAQGMVEELAGHGGINRKTVAIIGCNAMGLAAAYLLAKANPARMVAVDESPEKAMALTKKVEGSSGFVSFGIERCAEGVTTDLSDADVIVNFSSVDSGAAFSDLKTGAVVYDVEGSLAGLSWQKGIRYQGPYYLTMLQAKIMSDQIFGAESVIDEKFMESAEVIEIF